MTASLAAFAAGAGDGAEVEAPAEPRGVRMRAAPAGGRANPSLMQPVRDGLAEVPPLPHVVRELLKELSDPASNARSVARIAASDPALAASLIRTVNSAALGLRRKISSVADAVGYLGYSVVRSLVVRMRLEQILPARGTRGGYDAEDLWIHSLAVSYAADALAERLGRDGKLAALGLDRGFVSTLGLLHDIGKLAINSQFPDSADDLRAPDSARPDESFLDRERRVLGADHAEIGAMLAGHWKLPEDLVEAIRYHHAPREVPAHLPPGVRAAAALVFLANQLAKYCYVYSEDMEIDIVPEELFGRVALAGPIARLLTGRMRMAISRAIFFADESASRPLGTVRRFVRLYGAEEGRRALALPGTRGRGDSRVGVTEDTAEPLFAGPGPAVRCAGGRPPRSAELALRGARRARFRAELAAGALDALVSAVTAHQDALPLAEEVRLPARFLIRRLIPNLLELANGGGRVGDRGGEVEVAQSLDGNRYALALRCPALAFDRRFGPDATPRQCRRVLERELANVLNLRWFSEIYTSVDGQTLLFLSHAARRAGTAAAA